MTTFLQSSSLQRPFSFIMANHAWQITSPGTLTLNDLGDIPKPGKNEVLLRIHAAALNYRDKLVTDHSPHYPLKTKPKLILGSDGAGIIEAVGAGSSWQKGDRVVVHANTWLTGHNPRDYVFEKTLGGGDVDGTLRRWMVVNDEQLFKAPANLSLEEASTFFTAGVTAYRSIFYGGIDVGPGTTVLTQGTGGVSMYAIMVSTSLSRSSSVPLTCPVKIAAAVGATVISTSSSDDKLEIARRLGATYLINYRKTTNWAEEVLEATNGKGVDLVVDVVGAEEMEQTIKATAFGGHICVIGLVGENSVKPVNIINDILFGAKTCRLFPVYHELCDGSC